MEKQNKENADKTITKTYGEKERQAQEFDLTSDLFAGKVFEDIGACEELCRILLCDEAINIKTVWTQYTIRNLGEHSVVLDIFAEDAEGRLINTELQMYQEKSPFQRSRYYLSSIDMSALEKGKGYDELPEVTIIYITRHDFIGGGRGVYQVSRKVSGLGVSDGQRAENGDVPDIEIENGQHEKYFNLEYPTENEKVNELLRYIKHSDPLYQTASFPRIVERVRYFKMQKEGVDIMCEIADRIRREGKAEGRAEGRVEGKRDGRIESIIELLEELGKVPKRVVRHIQQETSMEVLGKWLKDAARASSIAEFEAHM